MNYKSQAEWLERISKEYLASEASEEKFLAIACLVLKQMEAKIDVYNKLDKIVEE